MGSCISKCRARQPRSLPQSPSQSHNHVQDKLVISRSPPKLPSPPASPAKSTTFSSSRSTLSNTCTTSSCSSSSTSSTLTSKDRSFSNEFLWSCARENPHVIKINNLVKPILSPADRILAEPITVLAPTPKQSIPEKRARPGSPNLSRQKSFRADACSENCDLAFALPSWRLPSPSRRFGGDLRRGSSSVHSTPGRNYMQPSLRKQCTFRPASPSNSIGKRNNWGSQQCCSITTELLCPKADQVAVKSVISTHADADSMEDIINPLISLDCFIFL